MEIEEKINYIGRELADIKLDIEFIKRDQKRILEFITNPDKLNAERYIKKVFTLDK